MFYHKMAYDSMIRTIAGNDTDLSFALPSGYFVDNEKIIGKNKSKEKYEVT